MDLHRKHQRTALARAWDEEPGATILQCSDAPDMSGANQAALEQAQLSRESLDWVKQVYEREKPARDAAAERAAAVSDQQLKSAQLQDTVTQESLNHYRSTFKPIEEKLAAEAMAYDTPQRREAAAGQAMADVGTQADLARETAAREMAARGVDPSSGAALMATQRGSVMEAAQKAAAGNQARQLVETTGHAYMSDAANLGRNIASSQGTTAGIALNAGNSSVANSNAGLAATQSGTSAVQSGYSTAINGIGQSAATLTNIGKVQAEGRSDVLGSVAGAATRWGLGKI